MLSENQNIQKVLAIQLGSRRDLMQTIPALQNLRQLLPHAIITLLVDPSNSQIGLQMSWVEDLFVADTKFINPENELALIAKIRDRAFDAAFIFTSDRKSPYPLAYICYLAGIPIRVGQSLEFGGGVISHCINPLSKEQDRFSKIFVSTS